MDYNVGLNCCITLYSEDEEEINENDTSCSVGNDRQQYSKQSYADYYFTKVCIINIYIYTYILYSTNSKQS